MRINSPGEDLDSELTAYSGPSFLACTMRKLTCFQEACFGGPPEAQTQRVMIAAVHRGQKVQRVNSSRGEGRLEVSQQWVDGGLPGKQVLGKKRQWM